MRKFIIVIDEHGEKEVNNLLDDGWKIESMCAMGAGVAPDMGFATHQAGMVYLTKSEYAAK